MKARDQEINKYKAEMAKFLKTYHYTLQIPWTSFFFFFYKDA